LILGGVEIPYGLGLEGHSDADVLSHAVIDAILGALAKGDIGTHFPDTDPAYEGVSSLLMLEKAMEWAAAEGYKLNNLDATVVAETPKLAPHIPAMRQKMALVLEAPLERINVKATTTEGLGFCGRREGIGAYAVVCLVRREK